MTLDQLVRRRQGRVDSIRAFSVVKLPNGWAYARVTVITSALDSSEQIVGSFRPASARYRLKSGKMFTSSQMSLDTWESRITRLWSDDA